MRLTPGARIGRTDKAAWSLTEAVPWVVILYLATVAAGVRNAHAQPPGAASPSPPPPKGTMASVLAGTTPSDWRPLDPENTLYLDLPGGRVVFELAPSFAPQHVANVKALVREGYFDGLTVNRAQDNYVVQWGDADGEDARKRRPIRKAKPTLPPEFDRAVSPDLAFVPLPDGDVYAPEVGWSSGFPAARDAKSGRAWLTHCYGTLGAGRGTDAASGGGTELFVVIGHSPRHLDRNDTVMGRVVRGIEVLSTLPRGGGPLGFYERAEQRVPIRSMRVAADVSAAERVALEVLRTDGKAFGELIEARRNRREEWFKHAHGKVELCNVPIPVRSAAAPEALKP
jgi:peptidylprolyl isomerase